MNYGRNKGALERDGGFRRIEFSPPDISEAEIGEVADTLRSGWITTGPRTKRLERELAQFIGTGRAVCLNSATAAEELILRTVGIGEGDEVIVPAYTYSATAAAVIHVGAKVVFIDSQAGSPQMDYDALEQAVNERTKAIIPVDIGGILCDYERLFDIAERTSDIFRPGGNSDLGRRIQKRIGRIMIIADCAHGLGAKRIFRGQWRNAGDIADFTSFSFHAVKNFTTGEGGAASWRTIEGIDDEEIYRYFQLLSLHGQSKDALAKTQPGAWEYDIVGPWYKCNMTDIMAAIGLKQLERYAGLLTRRREIIKIYDRACERSGISRLEHFTEEGTSSGHLYMTRIPGIDSSQRQEIITLMAQRGIACNVHYKPLPLMSGYKGLYSGRFPNAVSYYENEITLPLHTMLSDVDAKYVGEQFEAIVARYMQKIM